MNDSNNDVNINGNMEGNVIIGDGNQITVSSDSKIDKIGSMDKIASEMAIMRLQKEISDIKNADNEKLEIQRKYHSDNLSTDSKGIQIRLALILADSRGEDPVRYLSSLYRTEFNEVLKTLTVQEMEAIKIFYQTLNEPSSTMNQAVEDIIKDMERLIEIEEAKALLPQKMEELKKHRKIVENI